MNTIDLSAPCFYCGSTRSVRSLSVTMRVTCTDGYMCNIRMRKADAWNAYAVAERETWKNDHTGYPDSRPHRVADKSCPFCMEFGPYRGE